MFKQAAELSQREKQGAERFYNSGCAGSPRGEGRNKDSSEGLFMTSFGVVVCWFFFQACFTSNNTNSDMLLLTLMIFIRSLGMHGINLEA